MSIESFIEENELVCKKQGDNLCLDTITYKLFDNITDIVTKVLEENYICSKTEIFMATSNIKSTGTEHRVTDGIPKDVVVQIILTGKCPEKYKVPGERHFIFIDFFKYITDIDYEKFCQEVIVKLNGDV